MEKSALNNTWYYFMSLERDLEATSRYIEPKGQEKVYSFEFSKIIILSCTEIETLMKRICFKINQQQCGNIGEYKSVILARFPKIVMTEVSVPRLEKVIRPFENWDNGPLSWWNVYVNIKHNRESSFNEASYINAATSLAALYILILYFGELTNEQIRDANNNYIVSDYSYKHLVIAPSAKLPDFASVVTTKSEPKENVQTLYMQEDQPEKAKDGDIWLQTK
ncbi:MAG: hypothetical protein Q4B07_02615 [Clostridia bacterium]|nr:hypothetical protein [Clostridia bacterium]